MHMRYRKSLRGHRSGIISGGNFYCYSLILLTVLVPVFRIHVSIPNQIPYQACPSRRFGLGPWVLAVLCAYLHRNATVRTPWTCFFYSLDARETVKQCNFDGMLLILWHFLWIPR
ncbi:hypothetical protein BKA82DRAFT_372949 [Pisolithus tinctorius]|uniref:Uncharacterized protein n=1 Tax=Pisolithus tinctorius Marx 270 TaxID=870435 RepID=A0A0C3IC80_PISTI|nr:hypothetical protein BKA82DRAFT_372949 [Pisolithus tinctorius]KIN94677.1 hypothetical protein M404DRAFT_372949 [Pisolithus tinctorius Marx 270]